MDRFDRVFELHKILSARLTPISRRELEERMECSRATVARTIEFLRDRLNTPVEYDHDRNGYLYQQGEDGPYELPGLWFNPEELHALLTSCELLSRVQPGIFDDVLRPAKSRIEGLLNQRRRLHVFYHGRTRDETTERDVSPQRLVYYRDNWYLDGWCHRRRDLRTFSLDRLHVVDILSRSALDVDEDELNRVLSSSYGIFAGEPRHTAVLRFTAGAARWVADEQWHPAQQSRIFTDGSMEMHVPYGDPRELLQDILRFGPEVEVVEPPPLREAVAQRLQQAMQRYV